SPRSDTVGRRLAVLRRLVHPDSEHAVHGPLRVVVAPVRSVLQPQVKGLGDLEPVELVPGQTAPMEDIVQRLADAAYMRVDLVERRGEFAVRGGIVDVFPPTEEHPLRVEFWGDDVDEIRSFAVADQRTLETVDRLWAPPCRELLVELMPDDTHVLVVDPERARSRAHDLVATSEEFLGASWAAAAGGGTAPIDLGAASYRAIGDVRQHSLGLGRPWWTMSPFGLDDTTGEPLRDALGEIVSIDVDVLVGA